MSAPLLSLQGATAGYAGRPVLTGIDFEVDAGEVVALLGPNGAGKSTLVRVLVGLLPLTSGTLTFRGRPATSAGGLRRPDGEGRGVRGRIGYVPQRHSLGGGVSATVEEVVASGRLARRRLLPPVLPALDRGVVCDAIASVGLTEKIGHKAADLSGGQQRRVLIARALAGEPDVLVMDEPFAGVDRPSQEILAATLATLARDGVTLIIVTHEFGPIAELADRAMVLRDGRVAYAGPPGGHMLSVYGGHGSGEAPSRPEPNGLGISGPDITG